MATTADLLIARPWVGTEPDNTVLGATIDTYGGDALRAAWSILKIRRADMAAAAAILDVDGDASRSFVTNLSTLGADIERLEAAIAAADAGTAVGDLPSIEVGYLSRRSPKR